MNYILERLLKKLIAVSNESVIAPFYHKVTDDESTFEKHLYTPRKVIDFKKDIATLSRFYQPISIQKFIEISKQNERITQKYFHITFDDGLSNFYNVVAPILAEKKIPATIFVNSDFIDNKALFYRYKASLLYQVYENSSQKTKMKFYDFFEGNNKIKEKLFAVNFNNSQVLDDLSNAIDYSFDEYLAVEKPYLTTKQLEELIDMGFTLGAHSKSHALYSDIDFNEQICQTKDCVNWLLDKFQLDYKAFSFPFTDLDVSTQFFTKLAENKIVDISFGTSGIKKDMIQTNFQRIAFEIEEQNAENYLLKEYCKYFFKIPFGKNIMPRN